MQKQQAGGFVQKRCSYKFLKLTGKHLHQSLFFNKVAGSGLVQMLSCEFRVVLRTTFITEHFQWECVRFRGSIAIVGSMSIMPSCYFALLSILWVQNLLSWEFCLARIFLSWVYRGYKRFSRGYFVDLIFLSWLFSWFKNFQLLAV